MAKQMYDNSCGANALMHAAIELGVKSFSDGELLIDSPLTETKIYKQIGNGNPGTDVKNLQYSFPAQIVGFGRTFNLNPTIYMQSGVYKEVLTKFYPGAVQDCTGAGCAPNLGAPPQLTGNQREMQVMAVLGLLGLHWVLKRPNGSYRDPGDGKDYENYQALSKMYSFTGISVVLG